MSTSIIKEITSFRDYPFASNKLDGKGKIYIPSLQKLGFSHFLVPEAYHHNNLIEKQQSKKSHYLIEYYKSLSNLFNEEAIFEHLDVNGVLISLHHRYLKHFGTFGYMVNGVPFRPDLFFLINKIYSYSDPLVDVNLRFAKWTEAISKYCEGFKEGFDKFDDNHFFGMTPLNISNKIHRDTVYSIIENDWKELIYQPIERNEEGFFEIDTFRCGKISAGHYKAWSYILSYPNLFCDYFKSSEDQKNRVFDNIIEKNTENESTQLEQIKHDDLSEKDLSVEITPTRDKALESLTETEIEVETTVKEVTKSNDLSDKDNSIDVTLRKDKNVENLTETEIEVETTLTKVTKSDDLGEKELSIEITHEKDKKAENLLEIGAVIGTIHTDVKNTNSLTENKKDFEITKSDEIREASNSPIGLKIEETPPLIKSFVWLDSSREGINVVHKALKSRGYISCSLSTFSKLFTGMSNYKKINWIGSSTQLVYLIIELMENKVIMKEYYYGEILRSCFDANLKNTSNLKNQIYYGSLKFSNKLFFDDLVVSVAPQIIT